MTAAKLQNKMAAVELLDDCISDGCRRAAIAVTYAVMKKSKNAANSKSNLQSKKSQFAELRKLCHFGKGKSYVYKPDRPSASHKQSSIGD